MATRPRLLLLDNVDSFTFMLADQLRVAGAEVEVRRRDTLDLQEAFEIGADGIVVSPGPGRPHDASQSIALASMCVERRHPFLGVCLGHQALGLACGLDVVSTSPIHGKIAQVTHDGTGLFARLASPLSMTRYHSLTVAEVRAPLIANAWAEDGTIMSMRHVDAPAHGVQFHPESIASEHGIVLLEAFVALATRGD